MNIPQTNYALYFTKAILGMQAITTETCDKISRIASGIVYYGRALVQSRLYDGVCRLPRANKFVITFNAGSMSAGSVVTTITHGKAKNGEVDASTAITTVPTAFISNLTATLAKHAADIAAAIADCQSCVPVGGTTITFIGDCDDVTAVSTSFTGLGSGDTAAATSYAITTQDAVGDIIGVSYLDQNRQQQISGDTYYMDKEPVNIMRKGTVWVYGEEAVLPASTVYARLLINTNYAGYFGKSSDSSNCVALVGSKFQQSITTADLVPLTVNLPQ